ncbi:MAG: L,D-transpeptidase family protein [Clostridiales bacterium]|nr:L,D-transpeptidase family protein [Clostridiales bacterium]
MEEMKDLGKKREQKVQKGSKIPPNKNRSREEGKYKSGRGDSRRDPRLSKTNSERREGRENRESTEQKKKNYRKKKKDQRFITMVASLSAAIVLVLLLLLFLLGNWFFRSHYTWNTKINGISVFGMTEETVKKRLRDTVTDYTLTIEERQSDGTMTSEFLNGNDIGLTLVFDDTLEDILAGQSGGSWLWSAFSVKELEISTMVEYDEKSWDKTVGKLQCFQEDFVKSPKDASLSEYESGKGYEIIPEDQGNQLIKKKTLSALQSAVTSLQSEINLEEMGLYKKPAITSEDSSLIKMKKKLDKYTGVTITYTFGEDQIVLDGDTISNWISIEDEETVSLDEEQVEDFVATLRKKYDTIFRPRTFMTTYNKEVTLTDGDYGWWMNYGQEAEELAEMIKSGESGERKPVYYQEAACYGSQDYGDTYVEINLTAQHLFFYQDGKMVLESDFVSGNSSRGFDTPDGVYGITYKQRHATLTGEGYETPVSYWMPFNGNIGLHDATWRSEFGKSIYKTSGSHGCVNLPYGFAKTLYSMLEKGTPVICYHLEGTESDSVTTQGAEEIAQSAIDAIDSIGKVTKQSKDLIERARQLYNDLNREERQYVDNYDTLKEAEKALAELS